MRKVVKVSLPTVGDELLWSVGMSAYNAVYARISTEAVASVNISATIENFAYVLFIALADASTIMIGNQIGAGDSEKAMQYSRRFLVISSISSILIGAGLFAGAPYFIKLYNLSPESQFFALNIFTVCGSGFMGTGGKYLALCRNLKGRGRHSFYDVYRNGYHVGGGSTAGFIGCVCFPPAGALGLPAGSQRRIYQIFCGSEAVLFP